MCGPFDGADDIFSLIAEAAFVFFEDSGTRFVFFEDSEPCFVFFEDSEPGFVFLDDSEPGFVFFDDSEFGFVFFEEVFFFNSESPDFLLGKDLERGSLSDEIDRRI